MPEPQEFEDGEIKDPVDDKPQKNEDNNPYSPKDGGQPAEDEGNEGGEKPKEGEKPTNPEKPSNDDAGEIPEEYEKQFYERHQEIIDGWGEDRQRAEELHQENLRLKDDIARLKKEGAGDDEEDEEFRGLSERERIDKIIEKREREAQESEQREIEVLRREVAFYERTDPEVRKHKAEIISFCEDMNASTFAQGLKLWRKNREMISKALGGNKQELERKRKAGGTGGGSPKGNPAPQGKGYDPKTDAGKSFGDFFREAGIK